MSNTTNHTNPLSPSVLADLSEPRFHRAAWATIISWGSIFAVGYLSEQYWHPLLYVVAVMWIGNQQHSLLIQMHDGAHRGISRRRAVNEWFAELLCAWPMFFRMSSYRKNHLLHHGYTNTDQDPDFRPGRFPTSRKQILKLLITDVIGWNTFEQLGELKRLKKPSGRRTKLARLAYYLCIAAGVMYFGLWQEVLLYWIVPLFTWLKVVLRLRAVADHAGLQSLPRPFHTRTVVPNLFDRMFLAPRNCSYHLGHHLYAGVPWYNLKKLHRTLMEDESFAHRCRVTHGFWRLLFEFPWDVNGASERDPKTVVA